MRTWGGLGGSGAAGRRAQHQPLGLLRLKLSSQVDPMLKAWVSRFQTRSWPPARLAAEPKPPAPQGAAGAKPPLPPCPL